MVKKVVVKHIARLTDMTLHKSIAWCGVRFAHLEALEATTATVCLKCLEKMPKKTIAVSKTP